MTSHSPVRRALRLAPVVWVTFGLVQCGQTWVYALAAGRSWSLGNALVTGMPWWLSWLALTPLIARIAERYPFSDGRAWRSLGVHGVVSVAISFVQLVVVEVSEPTGSVTCLVGEVRAREIVLAGPAVFSAAALDLAA